jgi:hypothetical protein
MTAWFAGVLPGVRGSSGWPGPGFKAGTKNFSGWFLDGKRPRLQIFFAGALDTFPASCYALSRQTETEKRRAGK